MARLLWREAGLAAVNFTGGDTHAGVDCHADSRLSSRGAEVAEGDATSVTDPPGVGPPCGNNDATCPDIFFISGALALVWPPSTIQPVTEEA